MKKKQKKKKVCRIRRVHKYTAVGTNRTACSKYIQGSRGSSGVYRWKSVTCPDCLKRKHSKKRNREEGYILTQPVIGPPVTRKVLDRNRLAVVLLGNPIDGMTIVGPFPTLTDGVDWAYRECQGEYTVARIFSFEDFEMGESL